MISRQGVRASITQLQKLELPRKERQKRNHVLVHCLGRTQAEAFIKLKEVPNKEAAQQVLDDFNHDPSSCMGKVKDLIADMKDRVKDFYQKLTCTFSTGKCFRGRCSYKVRICKPGPQPSTQGIGSSLKILLKS